MRLTRVLTARSVIQAATLGTAVAMTLPLSGCVMNLSDAVETETRSVAVEHRDGPIDVMTENGGVTVKADREVAEVTINAEVRALTQERLAQTMIIAERTGEGALRLRVEWPEGKRENNEGVSFDITLPGATGATIVTKNGRITIDGLSGEARLTSSNGRITVDDHDGAVFATTSNGRVELGDIAGNAVIRTTNGRITVDDIGGSVDARTSNGAIAIDMESTNPGPVAATTSNGAITLKAGPALRATLDLLTSNGKIVVRKGDETMEFKRTARVEINGGGATGTLTTSNGRITVEIESTDD